MRRSVAAAAPAADAFAARSHFTGKKDMVHFGLANRIAVAAHGVVGKCSTFPRLNRLAASARSNERGAEDNEHNFRFSFHMNLKSTRCEVVEAFRLETRSVGDDGPLDARTKTHHFQPVHRSEYDGCSGNNSRESAVG